VLAFWADSFYDIVGGVESVAFGQLYSGYDIVYTGGAVASHAVEMRVQVVVVLVVVAFAELVMRPFAAAFNDMHKVRVVKKVQHPEDVRLVDCGKSLFHLVDSEWGRGLAQQFQHCDSVCRGLDAVLVQNMFNVIVHRGKIEVQR